MPKRVIDFDAMWASDKLAACAEWAQGEYAWLYGLADASVSFELTNLRVIWGRVAAIRRNLTLERLAEIFEEFKARGLLFTWEENGKLYGHWTGSDVPGRLPAPSWRVRLERLAPPVPREKLDAYTARYGGRPISSCGREPADAAGESRGELGVHLQLKPDIDSAQAQDLDLDLDWKKRKEKTQVCSPSSDIEFVEPETGAGTWELQASPEQMLEIYEAERETLPQVAQWNQEHRRQCQKRLRQGLTLRGFRAAVRRAAATQFLAGVGGRGWRVSFDWLVANDTNVRKVLEGRYDPPTVGTAGWQAGSPGARASGHGANTEVHAGAGPVAAAAGARLKVGTLQRIRAR